MPLAGRQLSVEWALALCYHVGFRGPGLRTAVAVMTAESARYVEAYNINVRVGASGEITHKSLDRGLFQINTIHASNLGMEDSFQAIPNATFAGILSNLGENWTPWNAYNSGAYTDFLGEVRAAWKAGAWRELVPRVEKELG